MYSENKWEIKKFRMYICVCGCKCVVCNLCNYLMKCLVVFLLRVGEIEVWRVYIDYLDLYGLIIVVYIFG